MISIKLFGTVVTVKAAFLLVLIALWGGMSWVGLRRHSDRRFGQGLLIGLLSTIVLLPSDLGHAFAHIASARLAGAPMDELRITAGMPRTLYWNNAVSPNVHRMRAIGGPVFNTLGLLLSLAVYRVAARQSVTRELAGWSAIGHGWILILSLFPLPVVDGGTLLKWTLVARGRTEADADALVRRAAWTIGILEGVLGIGFIIRQRLRATGG